MEHSPEPITWRTMIGFLVHAVVFGMFATPIALWVGPTGRPVVVRLAAAVFCAVVVYRLVIVVRGAAMIGQMSAADVALQPYDATVRVDPLLTRLANELRMNLRGRVVTPALWTHLEQLCRQRGVSVPVELQQQPGHRTWQDVERVVQFLEDAA
jgi:hypothetical protein